MFQRRAQTLATLRGLLSDLVRGAIQSLRPDLCTSAAGRDPEHFGCPVDEIAMEI
jgi:hypothetical protein